MIGYLIILMNYCCFLGMIMALWLCCTYKKKKKSLHLSRYIHKVKCMMSKGWWKGNRWDNSVQMKIVEARWLYQGSLYFSVSFYRCLKFSIRKKSKKSVLNRMDSTVLVWLEKGWVCTRTEKEQKEPQHNVYTPLALFG